MNTAGERNWRFHNPVEVRFGCGGFPALAADLKNLQWAVCSYGEPYFESLIDSLAAKAGAPAIRTTDISPNPDMRELTGQCLAYADSVPDVIVAIGGGSVIDSAKVFAAARGDFERVSQTLKSKAPQPDSRAIPIIAVPTTAGTGSEVTCWATVWDRESDKKYSLSRADLYPTTAVVDPELMRGKGRDLTVATGLDALSHALESLWNHHANPVSAQYAVRAASSVLDTLPQLVDQLDNIELRERMAYAATCAGLAFSNTRTALAHNLSYPVTLGYGVDHGIACSFTLPAVLWSVSESDDFRTTALKEIFGPNLKSGAKSLQAFIESLNVATRVREYGIDSTAWEKIVADAFVGERGKNFMGNFDNFATAAAALEL